MVGVIQSDWEAWHFLKEDRRLQFSPHILVEPRQTICVEPPIELCRRGLHASRRAIDALSYAPGPIVCRVRLDGEIIEGIDKAVATKRTCLWMADATNVLHEFACWCAEQAMLKEREVGHEPDPRLWAAIEAKRRWLRGEITDEELAVVRDAAWDAAQSATKATVKNMAWVAARAVAGTVVKNVARNTTWNVAWEAVWITAKLTSWDTAIAQNDKLEEMLSNLKSCAVLEQRAPDCGTGGTKMERHKEMGTP